MRGAAAQTAATGRSRPVAVRLPAAPSLQLAFLRAHPAYGAVETGGATWLAYQDRGGPRSLGWLEPGRDAQIRAVGDPRVAARVLQADLDLLPFDTLVAGLPASHPVRALHARYRGVRAVLFADPLEGMCWTVLAQQVSVAAAAGIRRRIVDMFGEAVAGSGHPPLRSFPSAEVLAGLDTEALRLAGVSRQKAATLLRLARMRLRGWDVERIRRLPASAALEELDAVPGIGPWSAEYALVRVFGHRDVLPAGDVGLRRAWGRVADLGAAATEEELRRAGDELIGWRSLFAFYLWLENAAPRMGERADSRPRQESRPRHRSYLASAPQTGASRERIGGHDGA